MDQTVTTVTEETPAVNLADFLAGSLFSRHVTMEEALNAHTMVRYVMGHDGVYEVRHTDIGTFKIKAKTIKGAELITEGVDLNLPRIPVRILQQAISFFKAVMATFNNAEAIIQIYWSRDRHDYYVYVPKQEVSQAQCHYVNSMDDVQLNDLLVADIHSHNSMGAFFSGTDNADDQEPRISGVIGKLDTVMPEMKFRISMGGSYCEIKPDVIFQDMYPQAEFPLEWIDHVQKPQPVNYSRKKYGSVSKGLADDDRVTGAVVLPMSGGTATCLDFDKKPKKGKKKGKGKAQRSLLDEAVDEYRKDDIISQLTEDEIHALVYELTRRGHSDVILSAISDSEKDFENEFFGEPATRGGEPKYDAYP
jgi:PRTRC genetic system protein A